MRYYATQRPIMPGAIPRRSDITDIVNFDRRTFCPEIGRMAWGYVEFTNPLTQKEIDDYELAYSPQE